MNCLLIPESQEEVKDEKNIRSEDIKDDVDNMGARRYYRTWEDAESHRRKGQRIYFKPSYGYYIVTPTKRAWWDIF